MATAGAARSTKRLTIEEFLALPDPQEGSKMELVRGRVVIVPPASTPHQLLGQAIAQAWNEAAGPLLNPLALTGPRERGLVVTDVLGRTVPEERRARRRTLRAPDIAYYARERYAGPIRVGSLPVAPTLAIELMSPEDTWAALTAKATEYVYSGTLVVWVIDLYPDDSSRVGAPEQPPAGIWARRFAPDRDGLVVDDLPSTGPGAVLDARPYLPCVLPLPAIYASAGLDVSATGEEAGQGGA
jgi:Uma2 family endonuclease